MHACTTFLIHVDNTKHDILLCVFVGLTRMLERGVSHSVIQMTCITGILVHHNTLWRIYVQAAAEWAWVLLCYHAVEANTYNSVPQQSSGGDDDGHYGITEGVAVVDNTALVCRRRCTGEWSVFQKITYKHETVLIFLWNCYLNRNTLSIAYTYTPAVSAKLQKCIYTFDHIQVPMHGCCCDIIFTAVVCDIRNVLYTYYSPNWMCWSVQTCCFDS